MMAWVSIPLWCLVFNSGLNNKATPTPTFMLGGVQVNEPDQEHWAETVRQVGMNTVATTVYARQQAWDSRELVFSSEEGDLPLEIRAARARDLQVVLVLRVALEHAHPRNEHLWHGNIMPHDQAELTAWFENYGKFVLHWARICEREGVGVLAIGNEMKALAATAQARPGRIRKQYYGTFIWQWLEKRRAKRFANQIEPYFLKDPARERYPNFKSYVRARYRATRTWARAAHLRPGPHTYRRMMQRRHFVNQLWLDLIARVRTVYSGKLTYAACFDSYQNVGFWHALDMIGINCYFPLHNGQEPMSYQQPGVLEQGWQQVLGGIDYYRKTQGLEDKPYLFTELGYTFRQHATVQPWNYEGFSVIGPLVGKRRLVFWNQLARNHEERALAVNALYQTVQDRQSPLAGILYWKLSTVKELEKYEPFMLHIGQDSRDPLQPTLMQFLSEKPR